MKIKKRSYSILRWFLSFAMVFSVMQYFSISRNRSIVMAEDNQTVLSNPYRELTAEELVDEMGVGWNLGNRFDAGAESGWGNPKATQEFFKRVHDMGFNSVRLPVTWSNDQYVNLGKSYPYELDQAYLDRVQDVVDYIISLDMYVAVNMHHDKWISSGVDAFRTGGANSPTWINTKARYGAGWRQISDRFKDYDEHLLFESMNEVAGTDASVAGVKSDTKAIIELNQIFTDEIRATGNNNEKRWLVVCGRYTNIDTSADKSNGFKFPDDPLSSTNRFMFSIHDYDYQLGLSNPGLPGYSRSQALAYAGQIQKLINGYTLQGIPIWFGEYGAGDKTYFQEDNDKAVAYWFEMMNAYFKRSMTVGAIWDNGSMKRGTGGSTSNDYFAVINREDGTAWRPYAIDATIRGYYFYDDPSIGLNQIYNTIPGDDKNFTEVKPVTEITLSKSHLNLRVGSDYQVTATCKPIDNNDPIIWTSSDSSIATVYNGYIRAKGTGKATITAYAQSTRDTGRTMKETLTVTAYPDDSIASSGTINVPSSISISDPDLWTTNSEGTNWISSNTVAQSKAQLDVTAQGLRKGDTVYYRSADPSVVSVNSVGKLVAISQGKTYVTVSTNSGIEKQVLVTVGTPEVGDVTGLTASGAISLNASESIKEATATVAPANANEKISFVSSDTSVAIPASSLAVAPVLGKASMDIIAVSNGTAKITASTPSGVSCIFDVTVSGLTPSYDDERVYRDADPSSIAPTISIDMPDTIVRNWLTRISYDAQTDNPDVTKPLNITMNVSLGGFELPVNNGIFLPNAFGKILVRAKAEDEFGNSSFASKTITVVNGAAPSKTPPVITFDMEQQVTLGEEMEIVFDVSSLNGDLPEPHEFDVAVVVEHGSDVLEVNKVDGAYLFTPLEVGNYTVKVTASDAYGNIKTESYEFTSMFSLAINEAAEITNIKIDDLTPSRQYATGSYELTFSVKDGYTAVVKVNDTVVTASEGKYTITIDANTTIDITVTKTPAKKGCGGSKAAILPILALSAFIFFKKKSI